MAEWPPLEPVEIGPDGLLRIRDAYRSWKQDGARRAEIEYRQHRHQKLHELLRSLTEPYPRGITDAELYAWKLGYRHRVAELLDGHPEA